MTSSTDEQPDAPVVVATTISAQPGQEEAVRELLLTVLEKAHPDPAVAVYTVHQGDDDPSVSFLYKDWRSRAALDEHVASPELQVAPAALTPLVTGQPTVVRLHPV